MSKFITIWVHLDQRDPARDFLFAYEPPPCDVKDKMIKFIEYSALEQANESIKNLEEEKTYLTLQLVDRAEKYKQFMDSGLDAQMLKNKQLEKENEDLKQKLEAAESALYIFVGKNKADQFIEALKQAKTTKLEEQKK